MSTESIYVCHCHEWVDICCWAPLSRMSFRERVCQSASAEWWHSTPNLHTNTRARRIKKRPTSVTEYLCCFAFAFRSILLSLSLWTHTTLFYFLSHSPIFYTARSSTGARNFCGAQHGRRIFMLIPIDLLSEWNTKSNICAAQSPARHCFLLPVGSADTCTHEIWPSFFIRLHRQSGHFIRQSVLYMPPLRGLLRRVCSAARF